MLVLINHLPDYSVTDLAELLYQVLPRVPEIQDTVLEVLNNLSAQSTTFVASFAAITTLYSASSGMFAVQKGLQRLTPGARFTLYDRLLAILYTIVFEGLLLAVLLLQGLSSIFRPLSALALRQHPLAVDSGMVPPLDQLQRFHRHPGAVRADPADLHLRAGRQTDLPQPGAGTVFATVGWLVFSRIFSFYIVHFWKLSYIYGSLTAIILMILWLDIIINLLFLGAAINAALHRRVV